MVSIVIDTKKYVLVLQKEYEHLQERTAMKAKTGKILSVDETRAYSKKLIRQWVAEK